MFQYFSHLGSLRAGAVAGSSAGSLSFACTSISHCSAVMGCLVAPSMGRPKCLTTSAPRASCRRPGFLRRSEIRWPPKDESAGPQPAPSLPWSER